MIPWIEYANPRAALGIMGDVAFQVAYLISAVWLFLLAVTILLPPAQRIALQVDLVLEGLLAIPTFVDGLLAKDGYHPYMRELLMEAKQKMEEELRVLDTVNLVPRILHK